MLNNIKVDVVSSTPNPQRVCALAMHNDYSEEYIQEEPKWINLDEKTAGERVVKHALRYSHWGIIEHTQLALSMKNVPHSVMQQLRTHRIASFDVQSMRYTGKRYANWYRTHQNNYLTEQSKRDFEDLFYIRPAGVYQDRFGNKIDFSEDLRYYQLTEQIVSFYYLVDKYLINEKMPYEMFRDFIPAGYRQNMVVSANARAWMHMLDMRLPKNAQLEINYVMELVLERCSEWMPEVFEFYKEKRKGKNKLAP